MSAERSIVVLVLLVVLLTVLGYGGMNQGSSKSQQPNTVYPKTSKGAWEFIQDMQEYWVYEKDRPGEVCQQPSVSSTRLKGDCDDFAVMIAYFLQEYWGHDTYILLIYLEEGGFHAVAFLHVAPEVITDMKYRCGEDFWYQTDWEGNVYIPIDMEPCFDKSEVGGDGLCYGPPHEWRDLLGRPY